MVNGLVYFLTGAGYFPFKQGYPLVQFIDRQRVQILLRQRGERIIGFFRNKVVHIHVRDC